MPNPKKLQPKTYIRKKPFWYGFLKRRRKAEKHPNVSLTVNKGPKTHKTEPDRWKPPFAMIKDVPPLKVDNQDLIVVNKTMGFDLGKVTATVGIMLQAKMD